MTKHRENGSRKDGVSPTGIEKPLKDDDLISSKTDLKGKITYANRDFIRLSGFTEKELLGQPHCIIRHPEMPRCVFRFLWKTIAEGRECFAFVINMAKNGDHYWVAAHVTPEVDASSGRHVGYISVRRKAKPESLKNVIVPLYSKLLEAEKSGGMEAGERLFLQTLNDNGVSYDAFVNPLL